MENIKVEIYFEDLPDSAEVTGRAVKDGGTDYYNEKNSDTIVLSFRKKNLGQVRKDLAELDFDKVIIEDIRF